MEHESEVVRRRVGRIADHVAGGEEAAAHPCRQLLPMNCSNTLNSVIWRRDSKLLFARQCSTSQACFMRQVSVTQSLKAGNCLQQNSPNNSSCSGKGSSSYGCSEEPQFAGPAQAFSTVPNLKNYQPVTQEGMPSSTEPPKFARPGSGQCEKRQLLCERTGQSSCGGIEWSPRMDVAESGKYYIVTLELPGANVIDIKVEVDDKNLIVTGKRSAPRCRMEYHTENGNMTYHRREIFQGPYLVTWPLPSDVNKDSVSAELLNGFLQITLPKSC